MGTNYYIKGYDKEDDDDFDNRMDPKWHIGKRSAAGHYCFDCDITLCKDGPTRVHYDAKWYDKCPVCGKKPVIEEMENSSVGMELGFNKNETKLKKGVASVSSFTFAMNFIDIVNKIKEEFGKSSNDEKVIINEYGDEFTYIEFLNLLKPIPSSLRFRHSIGKEFS